MPAAGSGARFGADFPKQYVPLAGVPVIRRSLALFLADPRCAGIRVVHPATDPHWAALGLEDGAGRLRGVTGGAQRCDSVRLGLESLPAADADWVLVHDAARPCLTAADLERLLAAAGSSPDGALLAEP